jgi:hypothetical protein
LPTCVDVAFNFHISSGGGPIHVWQGIGVSAPPDLSCGMVSVLCISIHKLNSQPRAQIGTSVLRPRFSPWWWMVVDAQRISGSGFVGWVCALVLCADLGGHGDGVWVARGQAGSYMYLASRPSNRVKEGLGRACGTSKQLRVAREATSVTSCLARTQDHPLGTFARDVVAPP